jgi:hypothetical protein
LEEKGNQNGHRIIGTLVSSRSEWKKKNKGNVQESREVGRANYLVESVEQ